MAEIKTASAANMEAEIRVRTSVKQLSGKGIRHSARSNAIKTRIAAGALTRSDDPSLQGLGNAVKAARSVKTAVGTVRGAKVGTAVKDMYLLGARALSGSDDPTLKGLGNVEHAARLGMKSSVKTGKAFGYSVKTAAKATRKAEAGYAFIKNNGLKRAYQTARRQIKNKVARTVNSLTSFLNPHSLYVSDFSGINLVKTMGMKLAVPLLLICITAGGFLTVVSVPVMAVGSLVSGVLSFFGGDPDVETQEYLEEQIPSLLTPYKSSVQETVKKALEGNVVRFQSDITGADVFLNVGTDAGGNIVIQNFDMAFPAAGDLTPILLPAYNAVVMMKYEKGATKDQAYNLLKEMFSHVFILGSTDTMEGCGQSLATGEGARDAPCVVCGSVHARNDCPNITTGYHTNYTCPTCCYYYCGGHKVGKKIEYRNDNCKQACNGYRYCGGHKVRLFRLSFNIHALEQEYFIKPINELQSGSRDEEGLTDQQDRQRQLQQLRDYYEIFKETTKEMMGN